MNRLQLIDDILVDTSKASVEQVKGLLSRYGLETKPAQPLEGGSALGLKITRTVDGRLVFGRGNILPETVPETMTRRELFSWCGKLIGHYPVAGWLRPACSFVKRLAAGDKWDEEVGCDALWVLRGMVEKVVGEDPVKGLWTVPKQEDGIIWCDASGLALGVVVEIGGCVAEDAARLRKKGDFNHINVAELEAALKGINLGIKWGLTRMKLMTDSATVHGWLNLIMSGDRAVRTKGAAEIIVKRRLGIFRSLVEELGLNVEVMLVKSEKNKADKLTRLQAVWMERAKKSEEAQHISAGAVGLKESHDAHHMGVDRTL